jgi:hypothetical protein
VFVCTEIHQTQKIEFEEVDLYSTIVYDTSQRSRAATKKEKAARQDGGGKYRSGENGEEKWREMK